MQGSGVSSLSNHQSGEQEYTFMPGKPGGKKGGMKLGCVRQKLVTEEYR